MILLVFRIDAFFPPATSFNGLLPALPSFLSFSHCHVRIEGLVTARVHFRQCLRFANIPSKKPDRGSREEGGTQRGRPKYPRGVTVMSITKTRSMRHNIVEQLDRKGEERKRRNNNVLSHLGTDDVEATNISEDLHNLITIGHATVYL